MSCPRVIHTLRSPPEQRAFGVTGRLRAARPVRIQRRQPRPSSPTPTLQSGSSGGEDRGGGAVGVAREVQIGGSAKVLGRAHPLGTRPSPSGRREGGALGAELLQSDVTVV